MRVQEYVLIDDHYIGDKVLKKGAYVKPIHRYYLPKHIKDSRDYSISEDYYTYCYTRYGLIAIPSNKIKESP